jgi:hypothetical protein
VVAPAEVKLKVRLKVEGIAPHGYAIDRATIRQKKTGQQYLTPSLFKIFLSGKMNHNSATSAWTFVSI